MLQSMYTAQSYPTYSTNDPKRLPEAPWQDVAADFFNFKNKEYHLSADTFSKYPFTVKISTKTADSVILKLTHFFHSVQPLNV